MTKIMAILIAMFCLTSVASAHPGSLHDHRLASLLHYITDPFHFSIGASVFLVVLGVTILLRKLSNEN